jgi:hypothetical protein
LAVFFKAYILFQGNWLHEKLLILNECFKNSTQFFVDLPFFISVCLDGIFAISVRKCLCELFFYLILLTCVGIIIWNMTVGLVFRFFDKFLELFDLIISKIKLFKALQILGIKARKFPLKASWKL